MTVVPKFKQILLIFIDALEETSVFLFLLRSGGKDIGHIFLHHFHQFLGNGSGIVHTGTHVDLNYPGVEILVYHKVVAHHLEETLFPSHTSLTTFNAPHNDTFHFVLQDLPFLDANVFDEGLHFPHALVDNCFFVVFLDRVVGEMDEFIVNIVERIVVTTKSKVAFIVKPDNWRIKILDEDPLTYVELTSVN